MLLRLHTFDYERINLCSNLCVLALSIYVVSTNRRKAKLFSVDVTFNSKILASCYDLKSSDKLTTLILRTVLPDVPETARGFNQLIAL